MFFLFKSCATWSGQIFCVISLLEFVSKWLVSKRIHLYRNDRFLFVLVSLNSVNVRANSNLTGKRDESQDLTITISNKITAKWLWFVSPSPFFCFKGFSSSYSTPYKHPLLPVPLPKTDHRSDLIRILFSVRLVVWSLNYDFSWL